LNISLVDGGFAVADLPGDTATWLDERASEWHHWQQTQRRLQQLAEELTRQQGLCKAAEVEAENWRDKWLALPSKVEHEADDSGLHVDLSDPPASVTRAR
jgi:DNA repair protein SbcC/Rad50